MEQAVKQRGRQLQIIISAALAGFMIMLDINIVNISLPEIAGYFNVSTTQVVQVTLFYLLIISSTVIKAMMKAEAIKKFKVLLNFMSLSIRLIIMYRISRQEKKVTVLVMPHLISRSVPCML